MRGWSTSSIAGSDTDLFVTNSLKMIVSQSHHEVSPGRWKIDIHAGQTVAMIRVMALGPHAMCKNQHLRLRSTLLTLLWGVMWTVRD